MDSAAVFALPLLGYLLLQTLMNFFILRLLRASRNKARTAILGSFWASFANGVYFALLAVLLRVLGGVETARPPEDAALGLHALWGFALGLPLWYLLTMARKFGHALFGRGEVVFAEEVVLRHPPSRRMAGWAVANLMLAQPIGRELFFRGLMLPVLIEAVGWAWALTGIAVFELLMRLNIAWLYQNLAYTLVMGGLFYLTGDAVCGLCAAVLSGFAQSLVLLRLAAAAQRERAESRDSARQEG
jgi:hypothetical protein